MKRATQVSVEAYFRTSYHPDVDYVDGVLEKRNVGEFDHSDCKVKSHTGFYRTAAPRD